MKTMQYIVVLIVAITAAAVMVTAHTTSSSSGRFRDELTEMVTARTTSSSAGRIRDELTNEMLPIYNIMLRDGHIRNTQQQCSGPGDNCSSDADCCLGFNCNDVGATVIRLCTPCGIATEACYIGRRCCNGFHCVRPSIFSLVGTCFQD
ncbi:hypothetical protein SOVF_089120 [Spinacia oleracea]|nr:hypothetical protein SOVF_089120 [Spinacia oleracea]